MKRKTETIICTISIMIAIWVMASWVDVVTHNGNKRYEYGKWNVFAMFAETETGCVVTDCQTEGAHYVVTIEDDKGNLWSYCDYDYRVKGTVVYPVWSGNEIVDIKGGN